jgi:serine/threonine protein kinase/Tol biopolymer transport system component
MSPRQTIAHYKITAKLGEGGMGEVWRATDTKLNRDVAIKILPDAFAQDADRMARFQREAQVLASLNHPNIAAIYGVEERALIMELVEGETLHGPMPVETAINYAKQIAEALEYAHERGIVHRDLKPANIKVTPEDRVKVLDFGLAKAMSNEPAPGDPTTSPTLTMRATMAGTIMGTAAYMSPEQAAGKPADKRADIWSCGVVLWEMLTGKRLFEGETISHTLADVLRAPIHFDQLPADTPAVIRELLRRCLDRDIRTRLRDIGEARIAIQRCQSEPAAVAPATPTPPAPCRPTRWIAAAALLGVVAAALGYIHFTEKPPQRPPMRLFLHTPPGLLSESPEISPDGTKVVFIGRTKGRTALYLRSLAAADPAQIPGTEYATDICWSPDSRRVGFYAQRKFQVADLAGGSVEAIADFTGFTNLQYGATWSTRGFILFSTRNGLFRIPEAGGKPVHIPLPEDRQGRFPSMLPDGRHFLYLSLLGAGDIRLYDVEKPDSGRVIVQNSSGGAGYLSSGGQHGHILFPRGNSLMALPFDTASLSPEGDPSIVGEVLPTEALGTRTFSASRAGSLGYLTGSRPAYELCMLDRTGKTLSRIGAVTRLTHAAVSPDGRRILYDGGANFVDRDLWVYDIARDFKSRITAEGPGAQFPIWSADGSTVIYEGLRSNVYSLYRRAPNAAASEEKILEGNRDRIVANQSVADRFLIYQRRDPRGDTDLWLVPLQGERKPVPLIKTQFSERHAQVSPDGRWLAYSSDETGERQIFIRSFTAATGQVGAERHQVSLAGGEHPRWSRDGRELYFVSPQAAMMAARPDPQAGWKRCRPEELFPTPGFSDNVMTPYDVTPDGKFVISMLSGEANLDFAIVLNWTPSATHTPK